MSWTERGLLAEAILCLGAARLLIVGLPFRRLAPILGRPRTETPETAIPGRKDFLLRLSWALLAAGGRLPWRCMCFEQVVAARLMLRRRGIPYTLYLATDRRSEGLVAHAWLRTGDYIVTGAEGRERFVVLLTFAGDS
jgi:hypothetical protein